MAMSRKEVGVFAFIAGLFIALVLAVIPFGVSPTTQLLAFGLIGIAVGILNIYVDEMELYMLASVALVFAASAFAQVLNQLPVINGFLDRLLSNVVYIVVPGMVIVSMRIIYEAAQSRESKPSPLKAWKAARVPTRRRRKR